jgi:hypothetical protein
VVSSCLCPDTLADCQRLTNARARLAGGDLWRDRPRKQPYQILPTGVDTKRRHGQSAELYAEDYQFGFLAHLRADMQVTHEESAWSKA